MRGLLRTLCGASVKATALALMLGTTAPAEASAIYTYMGNPLQTIDVRGTPPELYETGDRVTIVMELAAPLAPNLPLQLVAPLSFTVSDGLSTIITQANAGFTYFNLQTDGTGSIVNWSIGVSRDLPGYGCSRFIRTSSVSGDYGEQECDDGAGAPENYIVRAHSVSPGTWQPESDPPNPPPSVPEPTAAILLGAAILGLAHRRRRQERD